MRTKDMHWLPLTYKDNVRKNQTSFSEEFVQQNFLKNEKQFKSRMKEHFIPLFIKNLFNYEFGSCSILFIIILDSVQNFT